jgi:hypothetical protein
VERWAFSTSTLGMPAHSDWAAMVVIAGFVDSPSLGPPCREDQKCATLAAWLALAESSKAVSAAR